MALRAMLTSSARGFLSKLLRFGRFSSTAVPTSSVLVINAGSSSLKYQFIDVKKEAIITKGHVENIMGEEGFEKAVHQVLEAIDADEICAVGHRVVHGGEISDACLIDENIVNEIKGCIPLAPLHNPANLAGVQAARKALPNIPHAAVFDTAFHSRLPEEAYLYPLPLEFAKEHRLRRYGFHGTSHMYVSREVAKFMGKPWEDLKIISCHLGNGSSVAAVKGGHSVDTSMGFTPLEGLMMGTRSGDIDPGLIMFLQKQLGMTTDETNKLLNHECGLKGISGISHDLRQLQAASEETGHERATLAMNMFAYRVRKYIGAYSAAMGGVDAVIMTAGTGENRPKMRKLMLENFEFLGLDLDHDKNMALGPKMCDHIEEISKEDSAVKAFVVATDEELEIAKQTYALATQ